MRVLDYAPAALVPETFGVSILIDEHLSESRQTKCLIQMLESTEATNLKYKRRPLKAYNPRTPSAMHGTPFVYSVIIKL